MDNNILKLEVAELERRIAPGIIHIGVVRHRSSSSTRRTSRSSSRRSSRRSSRSSSRRIV